MRQRQIMGFVSTTGALKALGLKYAQQYENSTIVDDRTLPVV
jgi:hypothetical protein